MINEKLEEEFNEQLNRELYSAYLYQAMAAHFEEKSLEGFANWMDIQAQEEMTHARKFYNFINERGGRVRLKGIDEPKFKWESPLAAFEDALEHEELITEKINDLVDLSVEENDHAARSFLQWFVDEQVEEEDSVNNIVDKLNIFGDSGQSLYMLDDKLSQRIFVDETASEDEN